MYSFDNGSESIAADGAFVAIERELIKARSNLIFNIVIFTRTRVVAVARVYISLTLPPSTTMSNMQKDADGFYTSSLDGNY